MVELFCIVSLGLKEQHMTRSVSNTVRMSLRSMGKQLLYLMGTVTHQAPKTVFMSRSRGKIGVTVQFTSSMIDFTLKRKSFSLTSKTNRDSLSCCLRGWNNQGARFTKQQETPTSSLCTRHWNLQLSKKLFWLGTIQIYLCFSSIMQRTSVTQSTSDLKLNGRVRTEIHAGTSLQSEHFLGVWSLTISCSCMPSLDVIPRLVFTVWARNYQSHWLNLTDSFKIRQGASKDDIITAGETALVSLYNGDPQHGINVLRYAKFCAKAVTSTMPVQPGALPPTSASVKYYSLRVYHQIQEWLGVELSPVDWSWKISGTGKLLSIMTDLQPAPQKILEVVRCGCKSGCDTMRCSCRKHGIACASACSECRGILLYCI